MEHHFKNLLQQSNQEIAELGMKSTVGVVGSFTAMSINDWAGLVVAILTGIYMALQIELALRNRKLAKDKQTKENGQ